MFSALHYPLKHKGIDRAAAYKIIVSRITRKNENKGLKNIKLRPI